MDRYLLQRIIVFAIAAVIAFVVYVILNLLTFEKTAASRVRDMITQRSSSFFDKRGIPFFAKMGLSLEPLRQALYWAQLDGTYLNTTVGGILGQGMVFAVFAIGGLLIVQGPLFLWVLVPLVIYLPFMQINSKATDVKKKIVPAALKLRP